MPELTPGDVPKRDPERFGKLVMSEEFNLWCLANWPQCASGSPSVPWDKRDPAARERYLVIGNAVATAAREEITALDIALDAFFRLDHQWVSRGPEPDELAFIRLQRAWFARRERFGAALDRLAAERTGQTGTD